ncbi:hypothetical protein CSPX01_00503, partial [Colletotrichum filicis]
FVSQGSYANIRTGSQGDKHTSKALGALSTACLRPQGPFLTHAPLPWIPITVKPMGQWFKADTTQGAWLWGLALCSRKSV